MQAASKQVPLMKVFDIYYQWDLFNYFNVMNCKALWSISGVSAI